VAARLPAGPAGLTLAAALPGNRQVRPGPAAQRAGRRLVSDLRSGRALLASELSQSSWLDFGAFRWADVSAGQGVRAALGVMTPLIIGVATGKIEYGSYAALGALPAGFVSFRGVSWTRVLAVLATTAGMAVSTFTGATAAWSQPWLLVPIVFVWAYVSGLFAALGPTLVAVALQGPVALLIGSAIPLSPGPAAVRAALVLAGGIWQCLLVITSWTVNRGSAERTAVAGSYRALADYAGGPAARQLGPPSPSQFPASSVLADPNPLMRTAARQDLLDLAEEAERIRSTLTAMAISATGEDPEPADRSVLEGAARALAELAASIDARPGQRGDHLEAAWREIYRIMPRDGTSWQWADEALLGQLRSAGRTVQRLNVAERGFAAAGRPRPIQPGWIRDARITLRASLGTSSEAGRHALRLAVASAAAELIAHVSGLSHGYWAVLTVFIVLRPDYSSTLYRGLQRAAGTIVGAGLGVATVELARVSLTAVLAGIAVSLVGAYAVFTVNYLLYAVFLTDFVVVLLATLGLPPGPTAIARLIGTGVGTGLAILAYLLWPTWEGTSAAEKLARLFAAQGAYASAELHGYTRPGGTAAARTSRLMLAARRARTDAIASADRLAGEPSHGPMSASLARALISAGHRIAQAVLTLHAAAAAHHAALAKATVGRRDSRAGSPQDPDADLQPGLDVLADGVSQATGIIAAALRDLGTTPADPGQPALPQLPKLRPMVQALRAQSGDGGSGPVDGEPDGSRPVGATVAAALGSHSEREGLLVAADSLADAINAAAHVMRGRASDDRGRASGD
jgi:uncharacterized membrane protein YccC